MVEAHDAAGIEAEDLAIEARDLGPIGCGRRRSFGVNGGDGGLELIGTE